VALPMPAMASMHICVQLLVASTLVPLDAPVIRATLPASEPRDMVRSESLGGEATLTAFSCVRLESTGLARWNAANGLHIQIANELMGKDFTRACQRTKEGGRFIGCG